MDIYLGGKIDIVPKICLGMLTTSTAKITLTSLTNDTKRYEAV